MPSFSERDINEAKRRVLEMQNRASRFVDNNTEPRVSRNNSSAQASPTAVNENADEKRNVSENEIQSDKKGEDKSLAIILALIMILSSEGADHTLILALLYLLL